MARDGVNFALINQALSRSYHLLAENGGVAQESLAELEQAKGDLEKALAYASSNERMYWSSFDS
ncbi:hypothetical protein [Priestia koreensis]|uniref:hypothetical protein n=1 Tax=Priestia koreensis TaxID=284581 RepID=UPI0034578AC0